MGFFDFFKKDAKEIAPSIATESGEPSNFPASEGDLEFTARLWDLVQTPASDRGETWNNALLALLPLASFRSGQPQVIQGPDGFPYFQLLLPEPAVPFQCFVIDQMTDDFLLESGLGVVLLSADGQVDWVLTAGDLLNYSLSGYFYSSEHQFSRIAREGESIEPAEKVTAVSPSESILPSRVRVLLRRLLLDRGLSNPKVMLLIRTSAKETAGVWDLAFNIVPSQFAQQAEFNSIMRTISWHLPRHYSLIGAEEFEFPKGFEPL